MSVTLKCKECSTPHTGEFPELDVELQRQPLVQMKNQHIEIECFRCGERVLVQQTTLYQYWDVN